MTENKVSKEEFLKTIGGFSEEFGSKLESMFEGLPEDVVDDLMGIVQPELFEEYSILDEQTNKVLVIMFMFMTCASGLVYLNRVCDKPITVEDIKSIKLEDLDLKTLSKMIG